MDSGQEYERKIEDVVGDVGSGLLGFAFEWDDSLGIGYPGRDSLSWVDKAQMSKHQSIQSKRHG